MPKLGPIQRDDLIRSLKQAGFKGPHAGIDRAEWEKLQ